jgi:L,D-peptidoglycan transpeptidase YkuD (ErfK/YbiS/YcfS/YnhG family)
VKGPYDMRIARRRGTLATASLAASALLLAGCAGSATGARPSRVAEQGPLSTQIGGRAGRSAPLPAPSQARTPTPAPAALPGLGPKTLAAIPADARQAVLVTGVGRDSSTSMVTLYRYDDTAGWVAAGPTWKAHNAKRGWTDDHHIGDLRSPIGVFTLTDAGGRLADPGTRLTYDHAPIGFTVHGTGVDGEPLTGAFDYVIAINYNRKPGMSPRDWTRPLGESKGGGIWLHVDHGGPTEGCVSLPPTDMKTLLRILTPSQHPIVVMGDAADLAK